MTVPVTLAPPRMRTTSVLLVAAGTGVVVLAAAPFAGVPSQWVVILSDLAQLGGAAAAATFGILASRRLQGPPRVGWALLGVGAAFWVAGQAVWTYDEIVHREIRVPGTPDLGYLTFSLLAIAGVLALTMGAPGTTPRALGAFLDSSLVVATFVTLGWAFLLPPIMETAPGAASAAVSAAYPLIDLVILGLIATAFLRSPDRANPRLRWLGAGFLLLGIADTGFAVGIFGDSYATGQLADAGWFAGFLVLAAAATRAKSTVLEVQRPHAAVAVVPLASVLLIGLGGALVADPGGRSVLFTGGMLVAILALTRAWTFSREHVRASAELDEALRASQQNAQLLAEAQRIGGIGSWEMDFQTGTVTWSDQLHKILGRGKDQRIVDPLAVLALDSPASAAAILTQREIVDSGGTPPPLDLAVRRSDGSPGWVTLRLEAVRDGGGAPLVLRGSVQDVTEGKNAERARQTSAELTEALFAAIPATVVVADETGRLLRWNDELERKTGRTRDELGEASLMDLVAPEDRRRVNSKFQDVFDNGSATAEARIVGKHERSAMFITARKFGPPARPLLLGVGIDITERLRTEEILRRNERLTSLGTLVAGVAHEINNPLMYIQGSVEIIREVAQAETRTDPAHAEAFARIADDAAMAIRGLDRIGTIAQGLRQVARSNTTTRSRESASAIVSGILPVAGPRFGPDVIVETHLESRRQIECDPNQVSQVLLNLFLNSGDAMAEKGGTLTVTTRDVGEDVVIEISDTGDGIPLDKQAQIFTPFFTTKPHGTGLGLSVSRTIVKDHGGELTFTSQPGVGTTFRVRLPAMKQIPKKANA